MKRRAAEPLIEFASRAILWLMVVLVEALWQYVLQPLTKWFWGMVGRRVEGVIKLVATILIIAVTLAFLSVYWHTDFDLTQTLEFFKSL